MYNLLKSYLCILRIYNNEPIIFKYLMLKKLKLIAVSEDRNINTLLYIFNNTCIGPISY